MTHRLSPPQERVLFAVFHSRTVDASDYRMFRVLIRSGYLRSSDITEWKLTAKGREYCEEYQLEVEP